jgi:UDP-N-acetylmuramate--alanine ligase
MKTVAVSGTHGKTTTTAMLAKILKDTGKEPTAIVGSIVKDFGSNYVEGKSDIFVVEACEYKDHLLKLDINVLVITNIEWDHTDWFPSEQAMIQTFGRAVAHVPQEGGIVTDPEGEHMGVALIDATAEVHNFRNEKVPALQLIGEFNVKNAQAAKCAARVLFPDLSEEKIDASLASFQGSWRRFEYKGKTKSGAEVYDDYAHHPTAIRVTLEAVRRKFPEKKIIIAFHPHLYSRTRDLFDDFVEELSKADRVLLAPIYPAREEPIEGVTSDALSSAISRKNQNVHSYIDFDEIRKELEISTGSNDLVITMGAGDIYKVGEELVK